jgi:amidohydrolase
MNLFSGVIQPVGPVKAIVGFHAELTAIRRDLHAYPELGFEETRTAKIVTDRLDKLGIEYHTGFGKTGVVGVIHGKNGKGSKGIGLRADMDALPMVEENTFGYASKTKGCMHGCGHDGHTTMLLGAAQYLSQTKNFDGSVYLIFQPGEEGFAGGKAMMDDGLFTRFAMDEVYALHNWPSLPSGKIGVSPGPAMAAADKFKIVIEGKGGHGAHPYTTIDPVVAAGHMITALQSIVSRNVNPIDTAVLSICALQAGDLNAMSVIPRTATLVGTVRTFNPQVQAMIKKRMHDLCGSIAAAFGATAIVEYEHIYPATINTARESQFAAQVAAQLVGEQNVIPDLAPSMGAEDFSFMLQEKPGAYCRLGQASNDDPIFLHNTRYDFNDAVIPLGAGFLAALAEQAMPFNAPLR